MNVDLIEISSDEECIVKPSAVQKAMKIQCSKKTSILSYFNPIGNGVDKKCGKRSLSTVQDSELVVVDSDDRGSLSVSEEMAFSEDTQDASNISLPYYLKNFWLIVNTITGSPDQVAIATKAFTASDLSVIGKLGCLPIECQKMFVRLFQRQKKWIPRSKISYDNEFQGASDRLLSQLVECDLLVNVQSIDLRNAVELLAAKQVKTFSVQCGLFPHKSTAKFFTSKVSLIAHIDQMKTGMSHAAWERTEKKLLMKCRELIGACYCVPKHVKNVFLRCFLLFSLICDLSSAQVQSRSGTSTLQSQLFTLLEVDRGIRKFPSVTLPDNVKGALDCVYGSGEEVDVALWFFSKSEKLSALMDAKKDDKALELASKIREQYCADLLSESYVLRVDQLAKLPKFLRSIALPTIAKRALFSCSELYERTKSYSTAMDVFKMLLDSDKAFAPSLRGKVWERMVLDKSRHLCDPGDALKTALQALLDDSISLAVRYAIEDRISSELAKRVHGKNVDVSTILTPQVVLSQESIRHITAPQMSYEFDKCKTKFYRSAVKMVAIDNIEITTAESSVQQSTRAVSDGYELCSVEEVAMDFYLTNCGFLEGIHAEGSSVCSLMCLLFWDILFSQPAGLQNPVFLSRYQAAPLDLHCGKEFFEARREAIEARLELIESPMDDIDTAVQLLAKTWEDHVEEQAHGMSWTTFSSSQQACSFIRAIGAKRLASLLRILISDFAFYHSGFPDLTLWNAETGNVLFAEVKGPGDSLSNKQRIWLEMLWKNNIPAEVCRVEGVKSKRLSLSND